MENIRHLRSYQYVVSFVIGLIYFSLEIYFLYKIYIVFDSDDIDIS